MPDEMVVFRFYLNMGWVHYSVMKSGGSYADHPRGMPIKPFRTTPSFILCLTGEKLQEHFRTTEAFYWDCCLFLSA